MKYRDLIGLLTLGMLWGVSFLFIRVAVPEFGAIALMAVRVTLAAAILLPLMLCRGQLQLVLEHWRAISLMGVLHYAIPLTLFAYSMQTLTAGYSSVINASAPLFAATVAWIWMGERLNASRATGLAVGMLGVVLLVWDKLATGTGPVGLAVPAAVLAAFCYGLAAVLAKKKLAGVDPVAVVAGSMVAAALVLLPLSFLFWPATTPSIDAWGMAVALGILCTAAAFVLYFHLIAAIGPSQAITVTYLIPVFAVVFGALFIDEQITAAMIAGGLVVAAGTSLSTGLIDLHAFMRKPGVASARSLGLMLVFAAAIGAPEDAHADEWLVSTPVYLGANTFAFNSNYGGEMFVTLAATAELEMMKIGSPWAVSLFVEHHLSPEKRVDGTLFAGVQGSYFWNSMDLAGFWFTSRYPNSASEQTLMTRLRHQFAPGHKIGVEYLARIDTPKAGELKLGYYGSIRESVSLKFLFGTVPSEGWAPLARLELSWRLN